MDLIRLQESLRGLRAPPYRLEQVRRAVFAGAVTSYAEATTLPASLRATLEGSAPLLSFRPREVRVSADGRCRKALLELSDGRLIETVLLRPSPRRWTACISSQAGCALGCTFCATGLMGLGRDLIAEEITDQVLFWRQTMRREGLGGGPDNVVYMGMGEPFAAYESVARSLKALMDQRQFAIGARHLSVSTVGIAPKIESFGRDFPQVNLALSLHAAEDRLRARLVPLNKAYPLARLAQALKVYLGFSSRKVFLEYVLLRGENDRPADAERLIEYVKSIGPMERLHVNLIVFNPTDTPHEPSREAEAWAFHARLRSAGLAATVRQSLGRDIQGACGQLVVSEPPS